MRLSENIGTIIASVIAVLVFLFLVFIYVIGTIAEIPEDQINIETDSTTEVEPAFVEEQHPLTEAQQKEVDEMYPTDPGPETQQ